MAIISGNSKCEQIVTESTTICLDVSQYKQAHAQCPQVLLLFLGFAFPTPTDFLIFLLRYQAASKSWRVQNTSESVEGWCADGMEITGLREPLWKMTFEAELLRAI